MLLYTHLLKAQDLGDNTASGILIKPMIRNSIYVKYLFYFKTEHWELDKFEKKEWVSLYDWEGKKRFLVINLSL